MAAVIQALPACLEASRISTDDRLLIDHGYASLVLTAKLICCSDARWAGTENHDVWLVHHVSGAMPWIQR